MLVRLSHWGRVTHICVSKITIIGPDNGLSPSRHQAIIWSNAGILSIRTLGTNFSEILIEIHTFSFKKMHLNMSSGKWRPSCLSLHVLSTARGSKQHHWCHTHTCSPSVHYSRWEPAQYKYQPHSPWRQGQVAGLNINTKHVLSPTGMYNLLKMAQFRDIFFYWYKMAAISQTTFSNAFSWMKMLESRFNFHVNLFLLRVQLIINQYWFR